jgi:hypothetical protein
MELVRDTPDPPVGVVGTAAVARLAWVYGRINLANRILRAGFRPSTGFGTCRVRDYALILQSRFPFVTSVFVPVSHVRAKHPS